MKEIAGASLDEKQEALGKMSLEAFVTLCKAAGAQVCCKASNAVLIPGSFAYAIVSNETKRVVSGLRWSVCGDKPRVTESLAALDLYVKEHGTNDTITKVVEHLTIVEQ